MTKKNSLLFIMMLALVLSPHAAWAKKRHHTPHAAHHHGAGVDAGAGYADIVIDAETGRVIHETDSDELRHPASLTKMMTLYITFQALESGRLGLGQYLTVSENASYQSPSKLGLHAGQHIRVEDAILGLVTESANDAAVVLGETLGGSEEGFGQLMTKQAHALGMTHTVFHNPSGLPDPDQVTSAHDMALLGDALINHYAEFYPYFSHESFTYAGIYHHNHNHLMSRYEGMDGIKTGYIRASGFNLVASARRNGTRLIGVIFGGRSAVARDNSMAQLLDHCFAVAQAEGRGGRIASAQGEGDSGDSDNSDYVTLPAKISAIFPSHGASAVAVEAPQPQPKPATLQQQVQQLAQVLPDQQTLTVPDVQAQAQPAPQVQTDTPVYSPQTQAVAAPPPPPAPVVAKVAKLAKAAAKIIVPVQKPAPPPQQVAMLVPPAAPPPSSVAARHPNNWGIQIGAYSDAAIGQQALSDLTASMADMLSGGDPQVQKVSAGGMVMYRARLMALDKKTAQSVCSYLVQRGKSCLTVEP